jgi:hypothetical protein
MTRHGPGDDDEPLDDEALDSEPLDPAEAASGSALAGEGTGESLEERLRTVIASLAAVIRDVEGPAERLSADGSVFAVVSPGLLEVALDQRVARAALATQDTRPSSRGAGWVAFTPGAADRFALDRAESWIRFAYRRALDRGRS